MFISLLLATSKFDPKFLTLRMDHGDAFIFSKNALGLVLYFVPLPRNLSIINSPKVPYFFQPVAGIVVSWALMFTVELQELDLVVKQSDPWLKPCLKRSSWWELLQVPMMADSAQTWMNANVYVKYYKCPKHSSDHALTVLPILVPLVHFSVSYLQFWQSYPHNTMFITSQWPHDTVLLPYSALKHHQGGISSLSIVYPYIWDLLMIPSESANINQYHYQYVTTGSRSS